jgi:hypothetical protein
MVTDARSCVELAQAIRPNLFSEVLDFNLWCWIKNEVYKKERWMRGTNCSFVTLHAAARVKESEDQL